MTSLVLVVLAGLLLWGVIRMFRLVFDTGRETPGPNPEQQIVIEDEEESEVDRQNREYGDFYGDSYYW